MAVNLIVNFYCFLYLGLYLQISPTKQGNSNNGLVVINLSLNKFVLFQSVQEPDDCGLANAPTLYQQIDCYDNLSRLEVNLLAVKPNFSFRPTGFASQPRPPFQVAVIVTYPAIKYDHWNSDIPCRALFCFVASHNFQFSIINSQLEKALASYGSKCGLDL